MRTKGPTAVAGMFLALSSRVLHGPSLRSPADIVVDRNHGRRGRSGDFECTFQGYKVSSECSHLWQSSPSSTVRGRDVPVPPLCRYEQRASIEACIHVDIRHAGAAHARGNLMFQSGHPVRTCARDWLELCSATSSRDNMAREDALKES